MPVVGDPAVADTQDVGGDEIDWLAGAGVSHEGAPEGPGEAHVGDDAVACYQSLDHHQLKIRYCREETLACLCGPGRLLRAAMWLCVVHENRPYRAVH